jgi:hypothetical protein
VPNKHGTFVNAAEMVRRLCLARTPLADFFSILLAGEDTFQVIPECEDHHTDQ